MCNTARTGNYVVKRLKKFQFNQFLPSFQSGLKLVEIKVKKTGLKHGKNMIIKTGLKHGKYMKI